MIRVELSATEVAIEPGQTAQLSVTVTNRQEHDDHVFLEIEGIDVEWYALPVPAVNVAAGESQSARVLFKVGRSSDVAAGTYPFVVRARAMESGEAGVQQCSLTVKAFTALQLEIDPKRATSTVFRRDNVFDVRIVNLGNRPETLDLYASDPEDACAYEFETDRLTVKPGSAETVPMLVEPRSRPILGSSRLYQFTITARSANDAYVTASAHGQIERKAVLSTLVASLLLTAAIVAAGWYLLKPRPLAIRAFSAEPTQVVAGSPVTLSWDLVNAGGDSYITPGNLPVKTAVGTVVVTPEAPTTYTLVARGGGGQELKKDVTVAVSPKPPPPRVRIGEFTASHQRIHQGDVVTLSWRVEGAQALVLNPIGELNPRMDRSRQVTPELTTTYVLSAQGAGSEVVTKSVVVEVVPPNVSVAEIKGFRADPASVQAGQSSTLRWTVANALGIEIDNGIGSQLEPRGNFVVTPAVTTTYTLRAADNKGNIVTKQVTVTVTPAEPVVSEPAPP